MATKKEGAAAATKKERKRPGPKGKFTPERTRKIIKAIKEGSPHETAAAAAGISTSTFYKWLEKGEQYETGVYRDFVDNIAQAEAQAESERIRRINKAGREGDWKADAWYLERRYPEKYGRRFISADLNHSGEVTTRHEYEDTQTLIDKLQDDPEGKEILKQLYFFEQRRKEQE